MTEDTEDKLIEYVIASGLVVMGVILTGLVLVIIVSAVGGFLGISLMAKIVWIIVLAAFIKTVKFVRRIINEKDFL